jgi:hypothetical protein
MSWCVLVLEAGAEPAFAGLAACTLYGNEQPGRFSHTAAVSNSHDLGVPAHS